MSEKAAVIGSGFGGLSIAIRLQAQGFDVTIFEKNRQVGGHASQLKLDGYTFDMGPSLVTAPDILRSVFESAGERMEDYLDLIPLDPFYRIYYHDGSYLDYTGDSERMKEQMSRFNKKDARNYDNFIQESREIYNAVIRDGLGSTPFMDLGTMARFIPRALSLKALYPAHSFVKRHFEDPRHRFAFSFHPLFIGGNPFRAPAVYLMIPYLEKSGGVWFTNGGMYSVVQALERLFLKLGGQIRTESPVERIMMSDGKATGVRSDGMLFPADLVISNADFRHTYSQLIDPEHRSRWTDKRLENVKYSMSAYLLYLGVKKQYPQLKHHTLILSERYKDLVTDIFDRKILPDDFSMYLHVPTRTDPSMAPDGCESMYVLIPVANLDSGIDWDMMEPHYTDRILRFLESDFGLEGLTENIEVRATFTPQDFLQQRNNHLGSAWGVEPRLTQTAWFRPHNRSEDIPNLYFVGASTHPGAGVPGVLLTAEATERVILEDFQTQSKIKQA